MSYPAKHTSARNWGRFERAPRKGQQKTIGEGLRGERIRVLPKPAVRAIPVYFSPAFSAAFSTGTASVRMT
jgi:hypothetical protein